MHADATCAGAGNQSIAMTDGNYRYAQTFNPLIGGRLLSVHLTLYKEAGTTGDYLLLLAVDETGTPTNTVLSAATVPDSTVPSGLSGGSFGFPDPPAVVAGTRYALALTRPGSTKLGFRGQSPGSCTGQLFISQSQSAPFTVVKSVDADMIFTTFVAS